MKAFLSIALLYLILGSSSFSEEISVSLHDLKGSWYDSRFLTGLESTKSVMQAISGIEFLSFEVHQNTDNMAYHWTQIYNFHESIESTVTGLRKEEADFNSFLCQDCGNYNKKFKIKKPDTLLFDNDQEFRRVSNFKEFLNQATVAGIYKDQNSKLYFFYKNGFSVWAKDQFHYEVGLDMFESTMDYFLIEGRKTEQGYPLFYSFEATSAGLKIYQDQWASANETGSQRQLILDLSRCDEEFYAYLDAAPFQDLAHKSKQELRLLRNEILARHKHSFESQDLRDYFNSQPWYQEYPGHKVSAAELSEKETNLLQEIQSLEKR